MILDKLDQPADTLLLIVSGPDLEALRKLMSRGMSTWEAAPPGIVDLYDRVCHPNRPPREHPPAKGVER